MNIRMLNKNKTLKGWKKAPARLRSGLEKAIEKTAVYSVGEVKLVITKGTGMWKKPIDTGQMRQGIGMRKTGRLSFSVVPSSTTEYAQYVHEGTNKMRARPFFEITKDKREDAIIDFFRKEVDKEANKVFKKI